MGGQVDERLARLLGPGPRHAGAELESDSGEPGLLGDEHGDDWPTDVGFVRPVVPPAAIRTQEPRLGYVRRLMAERFGGWSFGPSQLAVIVVIVMLGLGLAGWSVLRARPVALASGATAGPTGASTPHPSAGATGQAAPSAVAVGATASVSTSGSSPGAAASSAAPMIKVHVLGEVKHPGVVELPSGSRVQDALDRAGGTKKSAVLGDLNLAQPLADGQQVFIAGQKGHSEVRDPVTVPAGGQGTDSAGSPPDGSAVGGSGSAPSPAAGQPINLNTATLEQLDQLPGVGPVTAQKIIDWRTQHGHFDSTEELQEVDGIGPKTYADLAPMVTV